VAVEHPRHQKIAVAEGRAADGAPSLIAPRQAEPAAPDMHDPAFAPGDGGIGVGLYQIAPVQPGAADGAGLGIAGGARALLRLPVAVLHVQARLGECAHEQAVAEAQEHDPYCDKSQCLYISLHNMTIILKTTIL